MDCFDLDLHHPPLAPHPHPRSLSLVHPCELHCRPTSDYFSEKLLDTVTDGTPCFMNNNSRSICVNGVCKVGKSRARSRAVGLDADCSGRSDVMFTLAVQEVGCDFGIDSNAVEDRCGVCLGDGTSCQTVHKSFDEGQGSGESHSGAAAKQANGELQQASADEPLRSESLEAPR